MRLEFSLSEAMFQINVEFPEWLEKIHDYVWTPEEDKDEE